MHARYELARMNYKLRFLSNYLKHFLSLIVPRYWNVCKCVKITRI